MLLLLAALLLLFTLLLLIFFINNCALLPQRTHPHPAVLILPCSVVKSPRRRSPFTDLEDGGSPLSSSIHSIEYLHQKLEERNRPRSSSSSAGETSRPRSDYLHPKYSLPARKCVGDDQQRTAADEPSAAMDWQMTAKFLRTPLQFPSFT